MSPETLDLLVTSAGVALICWLGVAAALVLPWREAELAETHAAVRALPALPSAIWEASRRRAAQRWEGAASALAPAPAPASASR